MILFVQILVYCHTFEEIEDRKVDVFEMGN